MLRFVKRLLKLLIARSENYNQKRQNSNNSLNQDQSSITKNSFLNYKNNSLYTKRKYIGPLFENKPSTIDYNRVQDRKPEVLNDFQKHESLRLEIKPGHRSNNSVFARSNENTAFDYRDMVSQELDPANLTEETRVPQKKGSNATVVVFFILLIVVGNIFPSAFRGVQFFFIAIILFFIAFAITEKFQK